ncbi:MAG: hypothetical protein LUC24_04590 [Bacteroidales bacterium]|nr:hypothetical protein [Bacteroidales bacterium]
MSWFVELECKCDIFFEKCNSILAGEEPSSAESSANYVSETPKNFNEWVKENEKRITDATSGKGTLPYFIRDNQAMVDNVLAVSTASGSNNGTSPKVTAGPKWDTPGDSGHRLSIEDSKKEYDSFDESQWTKAGFEPNGGYLVIWSNRIPAAKASKNSRDIYQKESGMCKVFARNGYRMVMLEEKSGVSSPDVLINGIRADLKKTKNVNNIEKYAKKAVRDQGAKLVLIQFDEINDNVLGKIRKMSSEGIHGKYFKTGSEELHDF